MRQAQEQQLFTVLDWGVANAKLEEVNAILTCYRVNHTALTSWLMQAAPILNLIYAQLCSSAYKFA